MTDTETNLENSLIPSCAPHTPCTSSDSGKNEGGKVQEEVFARETESDDKSSDSEKTSNSAGIEPIRITDNHMQDSENNFPKEEPGETTATPAFCPSNGDVESSPKKEDNQTTPKNNVFNTLLGKLGIREETESNKTKQNDDSTQTSENESKTIDDINATEYIKSSIELNLNQIVPSLYTLSKKEILLNARTKLQMIRDWFQTHQVKDIPFAWKEHLNNGEKILIAPETEGKDIWYIGDVHGDLLALESVTKYILEQGKDATIVFLGDLIDRQQYSFEVFLRVLDLIINNPYRILWIAGNHDIGLRFDESNQLFVSTVEPAEFSSWLNEHKEFTDIGKLFIEISSILPHAIYFKDGLCVVHGGVPGKEQLPSIVSLQDLSSQISLDAYACNRINPDKPRARGRELGWDNLCSFFEKASELLGFKVQRVLRGHDHCEEERHLFFEKYKNNPVLTFVSLSTWTPDEIYFKNYFKTLKTSLITTHHRANLLPEVVEIIIPQGLLNAFWEETSDSR